MRHLRILIIALAAILVLALAASALVNGPDPQPAPADDDIIIKGGSLDIQCGKNHKTDNAGCLNLDDGLTGKFKHKQSNKHITRIRVKNSQNAVLFDSSLPPVNNNLGNAPEVVITYKAN
jgi:phosphate-selective porin